MEVFSILGYIGLNQDSVENRCYALNPVYMGGEYPVNRLENIGIALV